MGWVGSCGRDCDGCSHYGLAGKRWIACSSAICAFDARAAELATSHVGWTLVRTYMCVRMWVRACERMDKLGSGNRNGLCGTDRSCGLSVLPANVSISGTTLLLS